MTTEKKTEVKPEKKKTTKKKNPKGKQTMQSVEFQLTDTQKAEKGMEAAKLQKEVNELTVEKKIATDTFAAKIKSRASRVATLLGEIDSGVETRDVECIEVKNFDRNRVEYYLDGEIVKERDLTEDDRQLELDAASAAKGKKKAKEQAESAKANPTTPEQAAQDNAKACVAVPGKNPPRGLRQEIDPEVADLMKSETNRKTKTSAVDGSALSA